MHRWLLFAVLLSPPAAIAQQPNARYELGWRVRQLERAWAANTDVEKRKLALPHIEAAVQHFFGLRLPAAAEALDRGTSRVAAMPSEVNWNRVWSLTPERRLVDASANLLRFAVAAFYPSTLPPQSMVSFQLDFGGDPTQFDLLNAAPFQNSLLLSREILGDVELRVRVSDGDVANVERSLTLSIVEKRDERLTALEAALDKLPDTAPRLERETARALLTLLKSLAAGSTEETDYPGARLLAEAEQVVAAAAKGQRWYVAAKTGQYWLAVPTSEKRSTRARIFVPALAAEAAKPPLVVALHGAGGSENMFFDSYGDGEIVRQCEKRGWVLVAPRLGFGGAPVAALVDELSTRYRFDAQRVFVVGHSMGAGAGASVVLDDPARYAAFAALGGGQALNAADKLLALPIFVGAGERDFGRDGAQRLHASLLDAGHERATLRSYPATEHLMIVQDALPDVFAFFDSITAQPRAETR